MTSKTSWTMPPIDWGYVITTLENGFGVSVGVITPEMAVKMLALNAHNNRKKKPRRIPRYISDMKSGSWMTTHEGVAFNALGELMDGQNRLMACIEADTPFTTLVFFGVGGIKEMQAVNLGLPRTVEDVSRVGEDPHDRGDFAVLRSFLAGVSQAHPNCSHFELLNLLEKYHDAVDWASSLARPPRSLDRAMPAPVRGVLARAYYYAPVERLQRFRDVIADAVPAVEPGDKTVQAFRRYMLSVKNPGTHACRSEIYRKTQWSVRSFLDNEDRQKILASDTDLFPLPTPERMDVVRIERAGKK